MMSDLTQERCQFEQILGRRVRDLRKRYGWTQHELARRLSMTQHNLSRYERAEYGLSVWQLAQLSCIFHITVESWFIDDAAWQMFVEQL